MSPKKESGKSYVLIEIEMVSAEVIEIWGRNILRPLFRVLSQATSVNPLIAPKELVRRRIW